MLAAAVVSAFETGKNLYSKRLISMTAFPIDEGFSFVN